MKKTISKKLLVSSLCLTLIMTSVPSMTSFAKQTDVTNLKLVTSKDLGLSKSKMQSVEKKQSTSFQPDDQVTIIVKLKEDSLLTQFTDKITASKKDTQTFEEYVASKTGVSLQAKLKNKQNQVLSTMRKDNDVKSDVKVLYHYTSVLNGFAIKANYEDLKTIKDMPEVENAFVAHRYNRVEPVMSSSSTMVGANNTWDLKYKGEGKVVAVVDTGLDTGHEAFQKKPEEPKLSKEQVNTVIKDSGLNSKVTNASGVYISDKIPYAYDYADKDKDVSPTEESVKNGNDHGTHVAGTVAASSSDKTTGVAPEAQLMIMKVFADKEKTAGDEVIFAGLEDAVKLGADVINMSLGSTSGFTDEGEEVDKVYDSITAAGISLSISAGNEASSTENNGLSGNAYTSNPDTATVGSPSTYTAATSVASVINKTQHSNYFTVGDDKYLYAETAKTNQPVLTNLKGQTLDYVVVPGVGEDEDYADVDVKEKVALVQRGGTTFTEKVRLAAEHGAKAAIIYNNQAGTINMSIDDDDYMIPAVSITQADGAKLVKASEKKIKVGAEMGQFDDANGENVSDFSSWGVSPNLDLKPEIAAPGENIYSTLPFDKYGNMSGTSMAAPHISGSYALVKEYIDKQDEFKELTAIEKAKLATQLLMSTARPVTDKNGDTYSPRKQGSGLENIYHAVTTKAYLYTEDDANGKPKLNLSDDPEKTGEFTKSFYIKNISNDSLTYKINKTALEEKVKDGSEFIAEQSKNVSNEVTMDVAVEGGTKTEDQITVAGKSQAKVTVTFHMSDELKAEYDKNFENGEFFEGYVSLDATEGDVDLTIPFLGFYGDWTAAPIFDTGSATDTNPYSQTYHALFTNDGTALMGVNPFDEDEIYLRANDLNPYLYGEYYDQVTKPDENKIAISPNGDNKYDSFDYLQLSLLRNAKKITYEIKDDKGQVVKQGTKENASKTSYYSSAGVMDPTIIDVGFNGTDGEKNVLANNTKCELTIKAVLDYDTARQKTENVLKFPITIDTEKPNVEKAVEKTENKNTTLDVTVSDNQYVSYVALYEKDQNDEYKLVDSSLLSEDNKGKTSNVSFDISKEKDNSKTDLSYVIEAYDYAGNTSSSSVVVAGKQKPVEVESVSVTSELALKVGAQAKITPVIAPANATDQRVTFESLKPAVATVDAQGLVKAVAPGTTTIITKSANGKMGYTVVIVTAADAPVASPTPVPSAAPSATPVSVAAPTKVTAKSKTKSITASWKKVAGASGYEVAVASSSNKKFTKVGTTKSTQYKVTKIGKKALAVGTRYQIKVRAYQDENGKKVYSSYSSIVKTATMPKKPALTVKAKNKKAKLSWKKVSGVSGYELYQSEKKGKGYKKIASCKSSITQYTKSGLKHKKNYYYKMRAYITNGKTKVYSDYSAVKKAKVK